MKTSRKILALVLVLVAGILVAGCGGGGGSAQGGGGKLTLGDIGWDESAAVANLTKVLFQDDLGYDQVEIQRLESPALLFQGVAQGELDAFQDVWLPNHQEFLDNNADNLEHLDNWYQGQTSQGVAVPSYLTDVDSLEDLNGSNIDTIYGIEPGTPMMVKLSDSVVPAYDLKQDVVEAGTTGMLAEVDGLYKDREPFAMIAWAPHWMQTRYDLKYLDDPQDAQGNLNDPATISSIVKQNLQNDDPAAYAYMGTFTLSEDQLQELEAEINDANGDAEQGARNWLENNRDVVQPWLDAARAAQQA